MLQKLPGPLLGLIMFTLFVANLLFWAVPVYILILLKVIAPAGPLRDRVSRLMAATAQLWARCNTLFGDALLGTQWDIRGVEQLDMRGQYLVSSNHQTWNDIYVLMKTFGRDAPFFKFFLKQQLIWVPVLGPVWWALDFPFMKRHTRQQIEKNPALRGTDLETTRRACEKYRNQPVMILNFLEGTRFTRAKHEAQGSPYRNLLVPKAGGMAFTLSAMGERLSSLLDVTIVYPEGACGFWDFFSGKMKRVIVEVRKLELPVDFFHGDYSGDPVFRKRVQEWVGKVWAEKDARIDEIKAGLAPS
jgi:1-acyl-sn-glycerol-3-phosphate acyltransferase